VLTFMCVGQHGNAAMSMVAFEGQSAPLRATGKEQPSARHRPGAYAESSRRAVAQVAHRSISKSTTAGRGFFVGLLRASLAAHAKHCVRLSR